MGLFLSSSIAIAAVTSCSVCSAAAFQRSPREVLLPAPTGLYQVGMSVAELIDTSRNQIFVPDPEPVKLMISVYYPVVPQHPTTCVPYFTPETALFEEIELSHAGLDAPNGTFEKLAYHLATEAPHRNLTNQPTCDYSLVVFMPGEGTTREFYNLLCSQVASEGYIVVSIDPAYDVDILRLLDGSTAIYNLTMWAEPDLSALNATGFAAIKARMEDVSFVLDQLSNITFANKLVPNLPPTGLNTSHTAMFGHSLGGATAFSMLESDDRVLGGIDFDGGLYGPGLNEGSSKPFMLVGHETHTRENGTGGNDPFKTWETVWPLLTGWKRNIIVAGAGHYAFTDFPIVFEKLGITPTNETVLANLGLMKGLGGARAFEITTRYAVAFLDFVIYGKCSALLEGAVKEFPEVSFEY